jgi:pyruvate,orthophosphate dikinase
VAVGRAAFDAAAAQRLAASGDPVVLVRSDINTADIGGLAAAGGILTSTGGRTAHASLIARQMGRACVVGCAGLSVHARERRAGLAKSMIAEGDWISIDGNSGEVFLGQREIVTSRPDAELAEVARWRATPALRQVG